MCSLGMFLKRQGLRTMVEQKRAGWFLSYCEGEGGMAAVLISSTESMSVGY